MSAETKLRELLAVAGVTVNGTNPWDIRVHDQRFYRRVLAGGSLAAGESYMDGWWDVDDMAELVNRLFRTGFNYTALVNVRTIWYFISSWFFNLQNKHRAFEVGEKHYDVGNDLYTAMLDSRMTYTCGYWKRAYSLDEAQEEKLDLICKKIGLKSGDRVLDIGGGWGSFAKYAAEKYGASIVAITVSKEQAALGRERTEGLPVEIRVQDYRDVSDGPYDHIVSIGMFEHVGYRNYRTYMKKVYELLKDDGCFLLHTIGSNKSVRSGSPWLDKYIFPNGMLPSITQIARAVERLFVVEDWHNFGPDYDTTLMHWYKNFDSALSTLYKKYNLRFYRMWRFYLLTCAGTFRARYCQLWQIVLVKRPNAERYDAAR
ncbi:MAG: cyclopropane fatty acyl phospholipid synthase [Patescibacteria group bacterium]